MERSGKIAVTAVVAAVMVLVPLGIGWHSRSAAAAQAAALRSQQFAEAAKQTQRTEDAVAAAQEARRDLAFEREQKRAGAKMAARWAAEQREADHPKVEAVSIKATDNQTSPSRGTPPPLQDGLPMFPEGGFVSYTDPQGARVTMSGHEANNYDVGSRMQIVTDQGNNHGTPLQFEVSATDPSHLLGQP